MVKAPTSRNNRFINYLFDTSWFFAISYLSDTKMVPESAFLIAFLLHYFNYFVLESITGKTFGKYITKTRTVNRDGSKVGFRGIFVKTLARLIPIEVLSFIGSSNPVGWHDKLSKTIVVDD